MILPLEKQVCSLELAKRLKELGAPQESWYMWEGIAHDVNESGIILFKYGLKKARDNGNPLRYAAYTVAELGELLPQKVFKEGQPYYFVAEKNAKDSKYYPEHSISYSFEDNKISCHVVLNIQHAETESDARAKCLIYLLEHKLINL